jgi:hypothetical protein
VKVKRPRTTTSLLNEKPIEAWFEPVPRTDQPAPRRCNACCSTPGLGCAKNYDCPCHTTGGTR